MRVREQAARKTAKSGFFIGVTCPGCGGSLELEQDFFILTCNHCGSALRVKMPEVPPAYLVKSRKNEREIRFGVDRYLKENDLPLTGSDISYSWFYYPFWKIDGILLKLRNEIIERTIGEPTSYDPSGFGGYRANMESNTRQDKITNISLTPFSNTYRAGVELDDVPVSLGIRADYLRLVPYSNVNIEDGFDCAPVMNPWKKVRESIAKGLDSWDNMNTADFGKNQTRLFYPRGSVIYFPYCRVQCSSSGSYQAFVVDGVTGRIETRKENVDPFSEHDLGEGPLLNFGKLTVDLHRCGNCGVDLPGRQSYVYVCHNCHELTFLDNSPLIDKNIRGVIPPKLNSNDKYFPFWAIKIKTADSSRLQRLFGGIYNSDRLVIPGFRAPNFEAVFRLSKRMSAAFPKLNPEPIEIQDDNFHPVTIGLDEALTFAEVVIDREETMRKKSLVAETEHFAPEVIELFYAPFHPESYFFVDSVLGAVTFEKHMSIL